VASRKRADYGPANRLPVAAYGNYFVSTGELSPVLWCGRPGVRRRKLRRARVATTVGASRRMCGANRN